MVQTRWEHLNEEYSYLTKAQALALDGHFALEQEVSTNPVSLSILMELPEFGVNLHLRCR